MNEKKTLHYCILKAKYIWCYSYCPRLFFHLFSFPSSNFENHFRITIVVFVFLKIIFGKRKTTTSTNEWKNYVVKIINVKRDHSIDILDTIIYGMRFALQFIIIMLLGINAWVVYVMCIHMMCDQLLCYALFLYCVSCCLLLFQFWSLVSAI